MKRHYWSDPHFWHTNVIGFCNRPYTSVEEMNESLIENHNKVVGPTDIIYCLGDFSFAGFEKTYSVISRLNGYKIFLMGNHDWKNKLNKRWERYGINEVHSALRVKMGDFDVNLSHYPYKGRNPDARIFLDQLEHSDDFLVHGHVHEKWTTKDNMINVGVDVRGYAPISEEALIHEMQMLLKT